MSPYEYYSAENIYGYGAKVELATGHHEAVGKGYV